MSEGELKKRIDQELKTAAELQYSPLRPRNQSEVAGMLEAGIKPNIHAVLDEARKDFPLCSTCKFANCHFKNQHATLYSLCPPREDWLVKWWGASV